MRGIREEHSCGEIYILLGACLEVHLISDAESVQKHSQLPSLVRSGSEMTRMNQHIHWLAKHKPNTDIQGANLLLDGKSSPKHNETTYKLDFDINTKNHGTNHLIPLGTRTTLLFEANIVRHWTQWR